MRISAMSKLSWDQDCQISSKALMAANNAYKRMLVTGGIKLLNVETHMGVPVSYAKYAPSEQAEHWEKYLELLQTSEDSYSLIPRSTKETKPLKWNQAEKSFEAQTIRRVSILNLGEMEVPRIDILRTHYIVDHKIRDCETPQNSEEVCFAVLVDQHKDTGYLDHVIVGSLSLIPAYMLARIVT
jgi:hypothetical protein